MALTLATPAHATNILTDADLVAFARAFNGAHWPALPKDGLLGLHKDAEVRVEEHCSDICPNYTIYVIHYAVEPGPGCTGLGGYADTVQVPVSIAVTPRTFCIPGVLHDAKLYYGHWRPDVTAANPS